MSSYIIVQPIDWIKTNALTLPPYFLLSLGAILGNSTTHCGLVE